MADSSDTTGKARIGFVGLGIMGTDLLKSILPCPKAHVTALCDISAEALERAREVAPEPVSLYDNIEAMLHAEHLDGVVVAAPQSVHASLSITALQAGCHVFCEKPMALNSNDCRKMISVAIKAGKGLMIGQVLRYIGPYRFVLEQAKSGSLGEPFAMRVIRTMQGWSSPWLRPWRLHEAECGGLLHEMNIHEIDLMIRILGDPVRVTAGGGRFANQQVDYEDFISANIEFANGSIGSVTSSCHDLHGRNSGELLCRNGAAYYDSVSGTVRIARTGQDTEILPYAEIGKDWEPAVPREMREFVEACLGEYPITIPGEEGMMAVAVCEAAYKSVRENRPVQICSL